MFGLTDRAAGFNNDPTRPPNTTLYFPSVGYVRSVCYTAHLDYNIFSIIYSASYNVTAQFTPVLKAYIVTNYQQNQILRGAVQTPVIWQKDLATLDTNSSFTLSYNPASGTYSITQDLGSFTLPREPKGAIDKDLTRVIKLLKELAGESGVQKLLESGPSYAIDA